jgi:hypothetical protein
MQRWMCLSVVWPDHYSSFAGRAKQVHVQQRKVLGRVEKKKVEVPKYKFIWRRKEVQPPMAISSRVGQEGGRGVEGRQDLKTTTRRDDCVDTTPPFGADPHALGTTLFQWWEDDEGNEGPMKEKVKPNFRTPPR